MMNDKFETGSYTEVTGSVLGSDINDPDKLYALTPNKNRNMFVVGSIATIAAGKTRSIVIPNIMQMIRREESGIVTGLYKEEEEKIKHILEANGYTVKIFDAHQKNMENSDTVDFMGLMEDDNIMVESCASTIMDNLVTQQKRDYWSDIESMELTFVMLYISTNDENIPKTLGEVYKFVCTHDVQEIEEIFNTLEDKHPAKQIFNTWAQMDHSLKEKTHISLVNLLQRMTNKNVQKLTGEQNIDFVELLTKKCVYLVPQNFNFNLDYSYLCALFISVGLQIMIKYYDSHEGKKPDGSNLNKVNVILDEFCNCGIIPNFDKCLSIIPSRGIDCTIVINSLDEFQYKYPNTWNIILDICSTHVFLKHCTYASRAYGSTVSEELMNKLIELNPEHLLVVPEAGEVLELKRVDYKEHPMYKKYFDN